MRKSYLIHQLSVLALAALSVQSCNKENGIDNDTVIQKPYSLHAGTDQGALVNTNDGANYKTIFPADGFKSRALITSGMNIIWVKGNVHMSDDNGKNFNPTYLKPNNFYLTINPYFPWQPVIINAADQNRVYIASREGKGINYSEDNGKTWKIDANFGPGVSNNFVSSLTQLQSGTLFAHNLQKDSIYKRDNKDAAWVHVKPMAGLPTAAHVFYLSHYGDMLLLTDLSGAVGAYSSTNNGNNWTKMNGLPLNHLLYATYAPFDETLLVGTDSMGVYRWENNTFKASNAGLDDFTSVYAITAKDDVYKNGVKKKYVYIATNKGLYRSEDLGINWTLVKEGSYVAVY